MPPRMAPDARYFDRCLRKLRRNILQQLRQRAQILFAKVLLRGAIWRCGDMTQAQFKREIDCGAMEFIARRLLRAGLISDKEYRRICDKFERELAPIIGGYSLPEKLEKP
jgi:hypothetical protein